jgi:hypothetical protein
MTTTNNSVEFEKINNKQSWQVFDAAARRRLGISAQELINRWDAGDYDGKTSPELMLVLMLRPSSGGM